MILGFCFKQLGLVKILQLSVMVTSYLHKLFYLFELEGVKNTKRLAPWETIINMGPIIKCILIPVAMVQQQFT